MSQPLADHLGVHPGLEHQGGVGVPQVMEADMGQSCFLKDFSEGMDYRGRVKGFVAGIGKDKVSLG